MNIVTVHNKYKFRGGEDESRESEDRLLAARGHAVRQVVFDNGVIGNAGLIRIGLEASWSRTSYMRVCAQLAAQRPDILAVHNFFPLASPSVYYAARKFGVPVVQTLHNYRLLCPGATFFRDGSRCEDCTRYTVPWPAVLHGCYRRSLLQTGAVSLMISVHRLFQTWKRVVSLYIAVSEFEKRKFVDQGFPEKKVFVKPNFVLDPGPIRVAGGDFVFVGRLAVEKGVGTLLRAMERAAPGIRLKIIGDGPLAGDVQKIAARNPCVRYLGRLPQSDTLGLMASARCLILPSECYETFGRVAAEAFARGTPVIGSRIGAVEEIVDNGRTGILFTPGDARELANAMTWACMNPERIADMRIEARNEYERKYTAERNYGLLMAAYERAAAAGN